MNQPLLSISILVSNRIDTIRKCMESIKPLLTEIPCELVAIDTKGDATDGSIDVVREYTDKIYSFEWCNDFAKARNFGMEKCSGKWFMFMDDDEWFEDVTEIVEFFKSGEYKKYHCANYKIHNYDNYEGSYSVATLFRMVEVDKETKFSGKIHEYLNPLKAPAKEFSAWIHHYGYIFDTEEEKLAHSRRNIDLLEPEYKKNPWDMHVRLQLLQEYIFLPELKEKADKLCEETIFSARKEYYKTNEFQWILNAYVNSANKETNYEKVVERAECVRKNYPLSAMADVAISIIEMNARVNLKQYVKGMAVFEHALERRNYLMKNPDVKQQLYILDFATYLEDSVYCDFLKFGIRCFYNAGKKERARALSKERFTLLENPVLTASVVAFDCEENLRKCLDSIKPLLKAVPSELIIVETEPSEVAKEYTHHIVPFVWNDDMAAARNAGLQAAKGDWFLYLNEEEWFENTKEIEEFFLSGEYLDYNSATYASRNYKDKMGTAYTEEIVARMIRRGKNTVFEGSIDEAFNNIYTPNKAFTSYVHNHSFAYDSKEEKDARMQYKLDLLCKDLERYPTFFRNRAQLITVLSVQNPREAVDICMETIDVCREKKESTQYQWQMVILYGLLEKLQLQTEAECFYHKLREEDLVLPVAEQVVCYRMTRIHVLAGDYAAACPYAKRFFELIEIVAQEEIPQEFLKYQGVDWQDEMLTLGGFCAWQAKAYTDAWVFYGSMRWETMGSEAEDSLWKLFSLAEEYTDKNILVNIVKRIMSNSVLKPVLGKLMQVAPHIKQRINFALSAQKEVKLSIGILVSNRIDTIRKCMDSLVPLMQSVPSELIALDTVGEETDGSIDVVKEYTDKVYCYEWCRDFADARNACLQRAKGEWFLFIDDDEWFDNVKDLIEFFCTGECKNFGFGTFLIRNYTSAGNYSTAVVTRLIRRTENTHFVGKVHEHFNELCPPGKQFESFLHHSGYAFANDEVKRQHQERNMSILVEDMEQNGLSPRSCAQMVQELLSCKETAEQGYQYCMEWLPVLKKQGKEADSCMQWMLAASVRYFKIQKDYEQAKHQAEFIRKEYQLSEYAELAVLGVLTELAAEAYDIAALPELAKNFVEKRNWLLASPEAARCQAQLDLPKYMEEVYLEQVLKVGKLAEAALMQQAEGPELKEKSNKGEVLVTVSLLVSNRKDTIRKCMESIKPLLEAVPSELIAVDTIGEENSDGSLDVVKEYTDNIVRFEWCNDFAKARNAGLLRAKGKWFLFLDDDEWFEDISPIIDFFKKGDYKNYDRAWYYVRNYHDFSGTNYTDTMVDRMCKVTKETKFEGRVHECLLPYPEKVMQFFCYVHHYGYAFKNEEERWKHTERNVSLLEVELEQNPDNARLAAQLVQEYAIIGKYEVAAAYCKEWLKRNEHQRNNPFAQYMVVMWLRMTIQLGNFDVAAEVLYEIEKKFSLKEVPRLACIAEGIRIELERGQYTDVLERAQMYFDLFAKINQGIPDLAIQQILDLTNYTTVEEKEKIMQYVISAMGESGQCDMATTIFDMINWSDEKKKPFDFMMHLVEFYGKTGRGDIFFLYAEEILGNPRMKSPFEVSLDGLVREHPELREEVVAWMNKQNATASKKQLSPEMTQLVEMLKANIQVLLSEGKVIEARELLAELKKIL